MHWLVLLSSARHLGDPVLSIAMLDIRRIFRSKVTWLLLLLALAIMSLQTVKTAYQFGASVNMSDVNLSAFGSYLSSDSLPRIPEGTSLYAREASPLLRLMLSFQFLDYLALAAVVVFGGFFAQDIHSGYTALRRCRGLSPQRHFAANAITITVVSFLFTVIGVAFLYVLCLALNPQGVNSLANGQMVLDTIFFLPQVAAAAPVAYVVLFVALYTGVLTFLGMMGYFAARLSGKVLVASVAPAGFILIFGSLAPALPWIFRAFTYDNLAFAKSSIIDYDFAIQYAGTYFIWLAAFTILGFLYPGIATRYRKVCIWLTH